MLHLTHPRPYFLNSTNELNPGSLTIADFKNEGVLKSFKDPEITVAAHLDMIMTKTIDAPMFHNGFNLTAYIPKTQGQCMNAINKDAGKLIEAARMYSEWISNFKLASATRTLSKNIAQWLETTLNHSTKDTRNNRNYRPKVNADKASVIVPQNDTKPTDFQKDMKKMTKTTTLFVMGAHLALQVASGMPISKTPSTR